MTELIPTPAFVSSQHNCVQDRPCSTKMRTKKRWKGLFKLFGLLSFCMVMASCPFESKVPMSAAPSEPIDSALLGYWYGIIKDGSDFFGIEALEITQKSDSVYAITRYGKAVKGDIILPDTAYFTAYTSTIGEQRFMNIEGSVLIETPRKNKQPEYKKEKVFYLSSLERRHDTLSIKTVSENFSPIVKNFKSSDDFRRVVMESINQNKNIYDDLYSLSYRKIQKPEPLKPINK